MNPAAVMRELKSLDDLEKRCKQVHMPSAVLLRAIEKRRNELLNPVEESSKPEVRK